MDVYNLFSKTYFLGIFSEAWNIIQEFSEINKVKVISKSFKKFTFPIKTYVYPPKMNAKYFLLFEEKNNLEPEKIVLYDRGSPVIEFNVSVIHNSEILYIFLCSDKRFTDRASVYPRPH